MALDHAKIEQYLRDTNEILLQLGAYIAQPEYHRDEADSGAVRRLRVAIAALEAACETLGRMPGPVPAILPSFPPTPEPVPVRSTLPPEPPPSDQPPPPSPPPPSGQATARRRAAPVGPDAPTGFTRL